MNNIDINKFNNIHFVGIGGIGVSAIARMMLLQGKSVSGSDLSQSEITNELSIAGAIISVGHSRENLPINTDLLIYTVIIPENNPELSLAKERGIETLSYPEVLGLISAHKKTIAVSGTHGKTTTTAMISKIFLDAEKDPTVVVGSKLLEQKSNFVAGKGDYFIVEACEYRRSFLNINPTIAIITNIDNDHLDYYKNFEDIQNAFREFTIKVPEGGILICDAKNERLAQVIKDLKCKVIDYMDFYDKGIELLSPGEHNRKNTAVAFAVASAVGIDIEKAKISLKNFRGTWRRFEYKGKILSGAIIYDDYGHHPTEIKATISGAREKFPEKKLIVIFQPHLYSRTKLLFDDFISVLSMADKIIITDIYAAREPNNPSITSKMLTDAVSKKNKNTVYISKFDDIVDYIKNNTNNRDVVITMGAGNVYKIGEKLID